MHARKVGEILDDLNGALAAAGYLDSDAEPSQATNEIGEDELDAILEDMPADVRQWALDMAADLMQVARGEQPQDPAAVIDLLEHRRKRSA